MESPFHSIIKKYTEIFTTLNYTNAAAWMNSLRLNLIRYTCIGIAIVKKISYAIVS